MCELSINFHAYEIHSNSSIDKFCSYIHICIKISLVNIIFLSLSLSHFHSLTLSLSHSLSLTPIISLSLSHSHSLTPIHQPHQPHQWIQCHYAPNISLVFRCKFYKSVSDIMTIKIRALCAVRREDILTTRTLCCCTIGVTPQSHASKHNCHVQCVGWALWTSSVTRNYFAEALACCRNFVWQDSSM